jgi:hypothetical protein
MRQTASKLLLICFFLVTYITSSMGQDTIPSLSSKPHRPDNFWHRVRVGGNLGFQFGNVTGITVAPEISIRAIDQLYVGFRFLYQYYNYKNYFWDADSKQYLRYESNVFGGGIYLRYYLASLFNNFLGNLYAHVEYEYQTYTRPFTNSIVGHIYDPWGYTYVYGSSKVEVNSLFVGGGYRQPVTDRIGIDFLILFNLNDSYDSPYSNPIFRLGVGVGL